jgi:TonB family protein
MKNVKICITGILVFFFHYSTFAQDSKPVENTSDSTIVEVVPNPIGGMDAFMNYFKRNFKYPSSALKDKVSGSVIVSFVVNKEGKITDCQIVKGVREDIDQEALRLISNAPDWQPGYQKGRYVDVRMSMPIHFDASRTKLTHRTGSTKKPKIIPLQKPSRNDVTDSTYAIIYGNFIQRLGLSSGGFPQYVHLYNTDTEERFSMLVKPTFKSARENTFCYRIKPGNYILLNYYWTQSKWYGGDSYVENIVKSERKDIPKRLINGFGFTVPPASTVYVGSWNFSKTSVYFTDDKLNIDEKIKNKHKKIDFKLVNTSIPD